MYICLRPIFGISVDYKRFLIRKPFHFAPPLMLYRGRANHQRFFEAEYFFFENRSCNGLKRFSEAHFVCNDHTFAKNGEFNAFLLIRSKKRKAKEIATTRPIPTTKQIPAATMTRRWRKKKTHGTKYSKLQKRKAWQLN